jgi:hypothetical protein
VNGVMAVTSGTSILTSVHAVQTAVSSGFEQAHELCGSPLCFEFFPVSGLPMEPRLYGSDKCRQQASLIRRTAWLLADLDDDAVINVLRSARNEG